MGSVTLEQILRLCPEVGNIYLLIRPKAGRSGKPRILSLVHPLHWECSKKHVKPVNLQTCRTQHAATIREYLTLS